ncbi:MAG: Cro/CI family transcriptional regulator [Porticoccaceae bacterium]|nr:Cro/CI family transcriptional regulator [Porticoccaceae bacterium]
MTTQEAKDFFGGIKELAEALGIWPHNISRWGKFPPMARQYEIEIKTKGALKSESNK